MKLVLLFFLIHWFTSLFFQTFWLHRYASHQMFSMGKFAEKIFHILAFIAQGPSYLSARAYAIMHRMHHAYADTEHDPHSPKYSKNIWSMMKKTAHEYDAILRNNAYGDSQFANNVPAWQSFDIFASSWTVRILFGSMYIAIYYFLLNAPWYGYFLIPIHWIMGPLHGAIINWGAHKYGYRNYQLQNTSTNLIPVELIMLGEGLHNNHHYDSKSPNFAKRAFEFDPVFPIILILNLFGVIKLHTKTR